MVVEGVMTEVVIRVVCVVEVVLEVVRLVGEVDPQAARESATAAGKRMAMA